MESKENSELIAQLDKILKKLSEDLDKAEGKDRIKILKKIDSTLDERLKLMQ